MPCCGRCCFCWAAYKQLFWFQPLLLVCRTHHTVRLRHCQRTWWFVYQGRECTAYSIRPWHKKQGGMSGSVLLPCNDLLGTPCDLLQQQSTHRPKVQSSTIGSVHAATRVVSCNFKLALVFTPDASSLLHKLPQQHKHQVHSINGTLTACFRWCAVHAALRWLVVLTGHACVLIKVQSPRANGRIP